MQIDNQELFSKISLGFQSELRDKVNDKENRVTQWGVYVVT